MLTGWARNFSRGGAEIAERKTIGRQNQDSLSAPQRENPTVSTNKPPPDLRLQTAPGVINYFPKSLGKFFTAGNFGASERRREYSPELALMPVKSMPVKLEGNAV